MRIIICTLAILTLLAAPLAADDEPAKKLNILFIMADDLRPELASYGSPALTPNLDRLAARSVRFERAYCQQALCNPSRSSMLTGCRPDTLGLWCNSIHFRELKPDVMTLPLWFKEHGYTTRDCGKIFHNWHTAVHGDPRSWSAPEFLHYANHGDDKPQVDGPPLLGKLPPDHATAPKCECRDVPDEAYYDGRVAAEAIRVLEEVKDRPFFLAVGFWKPHAPFNAPKRYWDLYQRDKLPAYDPSRPAGAPDVAFHDGRELRGAPPNQVTFTSDQAAEIRHGYFANIAYMDAQLGKVLAALDRHDLAKNTVIVFVADHGYHIGEQDLWGKTSNFELDAHVPLMVAAPGLPAGKQSASLVELVDMFPTLVELCQLPHPDGLEGTSFVPVLRDPKRRTKAAAFTQHPRPAYYDREPNPVPQAMGYSVRTASVRYTEWRDPQTGSLIARELYDIARDPIESRNQVDQSDLADAQHEAEELLLRQFPRKS
jgi:iduronate 2-sulfatase